MTSTGIVAAVVRLFFRPKKVRHLFFGFATLCVLFMLWNAVSRPMHFSRLRGCQNSFSPSTKETISCIRKDTVMFLKTHKTGSSTVTNILNRYGNKYNLTFALPKFRSTSNWPGRIILDEVINLWRNPNILSNHVRYNKPTLRYLFPKKRSIYITILREPFTHYESIFNYMELWKLVGFKSNDTMRIMHQYLTNVTRLTTVKSAKLLNADIRSRLLRNPMLYDLGLDFRYYQDKKAVLDYINFLEKEFDLVMIMEYFDESAVLLKRLMCWDLDDVVFLKHNERQKNEKKPISPLLKANIRSWNKADFMLYEHFNKTFWKKIAAEGPGFYEDLARFRKRKAEVSDLCIDRSKTKITEIYKGKFVQGHELRKNVTKNNQIFCANLIKNELAFYNEGMQKNSRTIEMGNSPGHFIKESDLRNDWGHSTDLAHIPVKEVPFSSHV